MTDRKPDDDFDLRARSERPRGFDEEPIPRHVFRRPRWFERDGVQIGWAVLLMLGAAFGTALSMRPPELVRCAIEHEFNERTLHGSYMDAKPLLAHLGLGELAAVPGYPQLMRPCHVKGKLVYHLTTYLESGGTVTVFAFDQPVGLEERSGRTNDVYWQVVTSRNDGRPLILVSETKKALSLAKAVFAKLPS